MASGQKGQDRQPIDGHFPTARGWPGAVRVLRFSKERERLLDGLIDLLRGLILLWLGAHSRDEGEQRDESDDNTEHDGPRIEGEWAHTRPLCIRFRKASLITLRHGSCTDLRATSS